MTNPPFFNAVDRLYHLATDHAPQIIKDRSELTAGLLGLIGSITLVNGLQFASKKMNKIIPNFDEKYLPKLEAACMLTLGLAPFVYGAIDPQGANEITTQHPTYTSGMAGVYFGSMASAGQDLLHRYRMSKSKKLEEKLNRKD